MAGIKPLGDKRNHGKQRFRRHCQRCGCDITARHGNARYCTRCTGKPSKPYVVSCRLPRDLYEKLPRPVQPWLEALIRREVTK